MWSKLYRIEKKINSGKFLTLLGIEPDSTYIQYLSSYYFDNPYSGKKGKFKTLFQHLQLFYKNNASDEGIIFIF